MPGIPRATAGDASCLATQRPLGPIAVVVPEAPQPTGVARIARGASQLLQKPEVSRKLPPPEADSAVFGAGGEIAAARIESDGVNRMILTTQGLHVAAGLHVPNADGFVPTAGSEPAAIGAKGQTGNHAVMAGESVDFASEFDVPKLDGFVGTGGSEPTAVGTKGHGVDHFLVASELANWLARGNIPDENSLFVVTRGQAAAVRTERHINDRAAMRSEIADNRASLDVPETDGAVIGSGGQETAIRAEGNGVDPVAADRGETLIGRKDAAELASAGVPNGDVVAGIFGGQPAAIATKGESFNLLAFTSHGADFGRRGNIPELYGAIPASGDQVLAVGSERDSGNPARVSFDGLSKSKIRARTGGGSEKRRSGAGSWQRIDRR